MNDGTQLANTMLINLAMSYEKEEGGRKVGREKKKGGEIEESICPASSIEQANGVPGALVLKFLSILQHSQRHKELPCFGEERGAGLLICL